MNLKTLAILLMLSIQALAATSVTLTWDGSPAAEQVTEYRIYQKSVQQWARIATVPADKLTHTITGLGPGAYAFAVTAFNLRESELSNEVVVPAVPGAVKNARVVVEVRVQ